MQADISAWPSLGRLPMRNQPPNCGVGSQKST